MNQSPQQPPLDESYTKHRGTQFSLATLFVMTTAAAIMLGAYFSLGRWLGMTSWEVISGGMRRLLYQIPFLLIGSVAVSMAVRRLRGFRIVALLTIISMGGMIGLSFLFGLVEMALLHAVNNGQISHDTLGWSFFGLGVVHTIFYTAFWIMIVIALFSQRPPDPSRGFE